MVSGAAAKAAVWIRDYVKQLEKEGALRGSLTAEAQGNLVSGTDSMEEAVGGAKYIQARIFDSGNKCFGVLCAYVGTEKIVGRGEQKS